MVTAAMLLTQLLVTAMPAAAVGDGLFEKMEYFDSGSGYWRISEMSDSNDGALISSYNMRPSGDTMAGIGYTFPQTGTAQIDVSVFIEAPFWVPAIDADAPVFGVMIYNKTTSEILMPKSNYNSGSNWHIITYDAVNLASDEAIDLTATYEAQANDEIVVVVKSFLGRTGAPSPLLSYSFAKTFAFSQGATSVNIYDSFDSVQDNPLAFYSIDAAEFEETLPQSSYPFREMEVYNNAGNVWMLNANSNISGTIEGAIIGQYNMRPSGDSMAGVAYTVPAAGNVNLIVNTEIEIPGDPGFPAIAAGTPLFGLMVYERKSQTVVWPAEDRWYVMENDASQIGHGLIQCDINYTAQAGDELVLIVKSMLERTGGESPYLTYGWVNQVQFTDALGTHNAYSNFSTTQNNPLTYYSIAAQAFEDSLPAPDFKEMGYFDAVQLDWGVDDRVHDNFNNPTGEVFINQYAMVTNAEYMVARGYTVQNDCIVEANGIVSTTVPSWVSTPADTDTMAFMIINRTTNTLVYPRLANEGDAVDFAVLKSAGDYAVTRDGPALDVNFTFEVAAGDEILLIAKSLRPTAEGNPYFNLSVTLTEMAGADPNNLPGFHPHTSFSGQQTDDSRYYYIKTVDFTMPNPYPLPVAVEGVSLDEVDAELFYVGQTLQLTATIDPGDAENQELVWISDNESAAVVSADGLVRAVGDGIATITVVTAEGGFEAECAITVSCTKGDVAADGVLDAADIVVMRKHLLGLEPLSSELIAVGKWDVLAQNISIKDLILLKKAIANA